MDIKHKQTELPEAPNKKFLPSPTMRVRFGDGKVVAMNRRERRRNHLYGDRLKITKRQPAPPPIFHSLAEAKESTLF